MKITRIFINGYKNLMNCCLEMCDFNVLIGENNIGKSNLLQVFSLLNNIIYGSDNIKSFIYKQNTIPLMGIFKPKSKKYNSEKLELQVEYIESIGGNHYKYWYEIEIVYAKRKMSEKGHNKIEGYISKESLKYKNVRATGIAKTVFERKYDNIEKISIGQKNLKIDTKESSISIINKIKEIKEKLDREAQVGIDILKIICNTPVLYSSASTIRNSGWDDNITNIRSNGRILAIDLESEIIDILKSKDKVYFNEILNDILGIKEIDFYEFPEMEDNYKIVIIKYLSGTINRLHELSDGTLVTLNLITYMFTNRYPVVAIEELENSIHPKLLKKLVELLKYEFNKIQVLITTHSPVLLNLVSIEDVNIIRQSEKGCSEILRVKDKKDLIKKLNNPFSSFGDIFYFEEEYK